MRCRWEWGMHVLLQGSRVPRCCGRSFNSLARPQEVAASALHGLCDSLHRQLQEQRHTAEEAESKHRTYLSLMAQKHKRLSEDAAHDSAHARESEAKCAELERALQASNSSSRAL